MKAIFDVQEVLQIQPIVQVQVVVGPPRDQEPADAQLHSPRPQPRTSRQSQERRKAEQEKRDPKPEGYGLEDGQENEEGELTSRGFGAAGGGRPDDLPERHRWHGEQGGDQRYFDPSLHEICSFR